MARQQTSESSQRATQSPQQTPPQSPQQSQAQQSQAQQAQPQQQARSATPGGAPDVDRERQRAVSREGAPGTGMQRGEQRGDRTGMTAQGRGATTPSLLPAFMASPDLMASAFMSNPFAFAQAMSQEMDRLFGAGGEAMSPYERPTAGRTAGRGLAGASQGLQRADARGQQRWAPQLEVFQRGNELVVRADLPGMRPDDVQIDVEDGVLTISGERREENEDRERGFYRSERSYGAFSRSIALPDDVDEDRVQARYEHGVLEITVPIPEPQPRRGRRVEIRTGGAESGRVESGRTGNGGAASR